MRAIGWILVAALSARAAPTLADAPTPAEAAARLAGICSAQGALGFTFGQSETSIPNGRPTDLVRIRVTRDPNWGPIGDVTLGFTYRSRRLLNLEASIATASPEAARQTVALVSEALAQRGLHLAPQSSADSPEFISRDLKDLAKPIGYEVSVSTLAEAVSVDCSDEALRSQSMDEYLGKTPQDVRPEPPILALPPIPGQGVCDAADSRAALIARIDQTMEGITAYMGAASRYADLLSKWKVQQLRKRAGWSQAKADAFQFKVIGSPEAVTSMQQGLAALPGLLSDLGAFDDAGSRGDQTDQCHLALRVMTEFRGLLAINARQWKAINDQYDAEARRLGVSID